MDLVAQASLIVATMDLKAVQLVRQAMRAADLGAGAGGCVGFGPAAHFQPRLQIHPTPLIESRPHIHPTPRFEPRPVYHPTPAVQPQAAAPQTPEPARITASHIQPPWKLLPWENPPQPAPTLKVVLRRPDVVRRGILLDMFV